MPGRDKTGPEGLGPYTGRGMGVGEGYGRGFGQGRRMRFGAGYGQRMSSHDHIPGVSQKTLLENEVGILKDQLSSLEKKLSDIVSKEKT